jgi:hypothetical protein
MPRRSRKPAEKKELHVNQFSTKSDFTVYEYAHSANARKSARHASAVTTDAQSGRLKKAAANAWRVEAKQLCGQSVLHSRHDLVTDCVDEDIDDDADQDPGVDSCDNSLPRMVASKTTSQDAAVATRSSYHTSLGAAVIYPLDLWFLVSDHISPEDVAAFARICHFTHIVVHSARFWFRLYQRFCHHSSPDLPQSLQPDRMVHRTHGLRARVVRALYIVYAPLSSRVVHNAVAASASVLPSADPQSLVGLRCVLSWHEHLPKCQWRFFFRFQRGLSKSCCPLSPSVGHRSTDALLAPADVMHNADEHSIVLIVSTPHFVALPIVMGQVLIQASISGAIFTQCLRLAFCGEYIDANRANIAGATIASIDPVVSVRVVHWWNPGFPHKHV